ncbi:MAG: tetratricopeptide repeat protein [Candidatus Omnitrophica bacterium]|nr:tetratricopeptide repeat protein [Candidatus Omnitrophota bacterium]
MDKYSKEKRKTSLPQRVILILFSLFLTAAILEIGLRLGGFIITSLQEHRNLQSMKQKGVCRIMCLGESTTQGEYPPYLEKTLNQRNIGIKFSVIDEGLAGANTKTIVSDLEANLDKYRPDIIVAMMGINDWGDHIPYETASNSRIILFIRSLKVYKLSRFLWLHARAKARERRISTLIAKDKFKPMYKKEDILCAEEILKNAIELNPKNDSAYAGLGWFYLNEKKFAEAERALKKAIELNPKNDSVYTGLGWVYFDQRKLSEAEQVLKKAIELNPKNDSAYTVLGRVYLGQKRLLEAEQALKKAIELNPKNSWAYVGLGRLYSGEKGFPPETEQIFKKAIELNPQNDRLYGALARLYSDRGNNELAKIYMNKANSLREEYYSPMTISDYHKLKQILDKRNIRLVCVQYPMRSIAPLKKIVGETGGIIFVDNEKIFKDAVAKEGYKEYFRDMFGGDFGHCTPKGNSLLANNIADNILKELFVYIK